MDNSVIQFQFEDEASAYMAFDSLEELGYNPVYYAMEHPGIHIHLDRCDLTSALEIAQMHGGTLLESSPMTTEDEAYGMAYHMEGIRIPAHVVNEDWTSEYAVEPGSEQDIEIGAELGTNQESDKHEHDNDELMSDDDRKFSYFSGEVNM